MTAFDEIRCLDLPLAAALEALAASLDAQGPDFARAYADLVMRLVRAGAGDGALRAGDPMPPFALPDSTGRLRRMEEFLAAGPLVISFNRGHWCPFCRLELLALQKIRPDLAARGAGLVSIMPETAAYTRQLALRDGLDFPILTDIDNGYALLADLMIALGPEVSALMRAAGADLPLYQGGGAWFVPIPATCIVAPDGRIAAAHVDADFRRRMPPEAILATLDAIPRPG